MIKTHIENLKNDFRHHQTLLFVIFIFFMGAGFAFLATRGADDSAAVSADGFNPGNIISDAVMANYKSMTVSEIQAFLTEKNPCNNRNYALYLEQSTLYPKISWHWTGSKTDGHFVCLSEEKFGDGVEIGEGETAAEIIYAAAQEYKINPQVLLVLLEKEQGLISDTYPHSNQYRSATGYGCPDTAACDSKYFGFKNQVFRAAELFRYTLDNGSVLYPDNKPGVYVAYNPSPSCGGTEVFIENRATSALYRYTPYQPNSAALSAGFGQGDICSAYGNRNFYLYFTKWFGDPSVSTPAFKLSEAILEDGGIPWRNLDTPRYLATMANSEYLDTLTGETIDTIPEGTVLYFSQKVFLTDGDMCLRVDGDTPKPNSCILFSTLTEYHLELYPLDTPRSLVVNQAVSLYNPFTNTVVRELDLYDQHYYTHKVLLSDGWCLVYDDNKNCAPLKNLTELDKGWIIMETPRTMAMIGSGYKIDASTNTLDKSVLLYDGMQRQFVSKTLLNGSWCLRTEYDHERNTNSCIDWRSLRDI